MIKPQGDLEVWRAIPATPGYEASTHGRIRKWEDGEPCILKARPTTAGCMMVPTKAPQGRFLESVAGLVIQTFQGNCPVEGWVISHRDANLKNNRSDNLIYESRAVRRLRVNALRPRPKHLDHQKWEADIIEAYKSGMKVVAIGEKFGVNNLYYILRKYNIPLRRTVRDYYD